jgi:hypothetical protein
MLKFVLRLFWRTLVVTRRLIGFFLRGSTILLICLMLLFNFASLTVSSLNTALSAGILAVSGLATISMKKTSALKLAEANASELSTNLNKVNRDLSVERKKSDILASKYGKVEIEARKLRVDGPQIKFRGKSRPMRAVVEEVTGSVSRRTAKVAAANVGSMAGEGIPFWGIAVIVGATTFEMAAACDTMKDMRALEEALAPDETPTVEARKVCGMRVPTAKELWEKIQSSPGNAWESAATWLGDMPTPDFSATWQWFVERLSWD